MKEKAFEIWVTLICLLTVAELVGYMFSFKAGNVTAVILLVVAFIGALIVTMVE